MRVSPRLYHLAFEDLAPVAEELAALLSPDESIRRDRYITPGVARRFASGRGVLRILLGLTAGVRARDIQLSREPYGKPRVSGLGNRGDVHFNVSHTDRVLLIAIGNARVGVDVEHIGAFGGDANLDGHLSPAELDQLRRFSPSDMRGGLAWIWTRKEAVLKAAGTGLGVPLSAIDVAGQTVTSDWLDPLVPEWHVVTKRLEDGHVYSLSVPAGCSLSYETVGRSSGAAALYEALAAERSE